MYSNLDRYAMAYKKALAGHWHPHDLERAWPKLYQALLDCHIDESPLFSWQESRLSMAHERACFVIGIPATAEAIVAYITMDRHAPNTYVIP